MDIDKKFELLRFDRANFKPYIQEAFKEVESFIIKNGLILVGGMSMDSALRLKGSKLYSEGSIPDYDALSPKHWFHCYRLAEELCKKGFPNVDCVNAIHFTTMKVRVQGIVVMDCTYSPPSVFSKIATLEYKGMNIIHPHYAVMDQLSAMTFPFARPPKEVIQERLQKDNKRMKLVLDHYPFETTIKVAEREAQVGMSSSAELIKTDIKGSYIMGGWDALKYYLPNFDEPQSYVKEIYTTELEKVIELNSIKKVKFYNPLIEIPRCAVGYIGAQEIRIYDTSNKIITIDSKSKYISFQMCLWCFVSYYLLKPDDPNRDKYLEAVVSLYDSLRLNPREPSLDTYGNRDLNDGTLYNLRVFKEPTLRNSRPPNFSFRTAECVIDKSFDYNKSENFQIDGSETPSLRPFLQDLDLSIS